MMVVSDISRIDRQAWCQLVDNAASSSVFQTPDCYDFYASLSFVEPFVFAVYEDNKLQGVISGFIQRDGGKLKQFFSARAIVNGGPLLADTISDEALSELLITCKSYIRNKAIYIEFRNLNDYSKFQSLFQTLGFDYEPHLGFIVDTVDDEEQILARMEKKRRQHIRSSLKEGAVIDTSPSLDDLRILYKMLQHLYTTKVKTPLVPFEFFEKLYKSPVGLFLIIKYQGEVIGGQVSMISPSKKVYDLYMTGDDVAFKKLRPSTLATYSGIWYAANNGFYACDLMGAGKPGVPYGVRDFKASFGGTLVEYGRNRFVCNRFLFAMGSLAVKLLKKF